MRKIAVLASAGAALLLAVDAPEGKRWWDHVRYLADDGLEGRNTGSPGHRKAAEYVAAQFERMGAKPAGTSGYFQPVKFRSRKIVEEKSSLELITDGKAEKLTLGEHAYFGLRSELDPNVEAEAVFVGYGLQIPELGIDDLAGLDLKGKVAVMLSGMPEKVPATVGAHFGTTAERWAGMRKAGAIGTVSFGNPKRTEIPWERMRPTRLMPFMSLAEPALVDTAGVRISLAVNPAYAEMLFVGSGHTAAELFALDLEKKPLPRFPLKVSFRSKPVFTSGELTSDNVAAIIPGNDPALKNEYIIFSAHLDHVGTSDAPVNGDRIYNGAIDNASGIASMIELGWMTTAAKLKRSVLLLAVTGEEKGLLGSRYFSLKPTIPMDKAVANINLDMFLPIVPMKAVTAYGLDESTLGDDFRQAASAAGVAIEPDREPHRVLFVRSDQYNFVIRGVPALSFKIAGTPGSPEQKTLDQWIRDRYHGTTDDLNQPVDLEAAAQFNRLMFALVEKVANRESKPVWKDQSFFRRFRN